MARPNPDEREQPALDPAEAKELIETLGNGIPEVLQRVIQWAIEQGVQSPVESTLPPINPHRAAHFPPERADLTGASVSGLHRWFHRQRRQAAGQ